MALKKTTGGNRHVNVRNMKSVDFVKNLMRNECAYKFMSNV